jgi:transposase
MEFTIMVTRSKTSSRPSARVAEVSSAVLPHRWCVGVDLHKDSMTICVYCPCCGEIRFQKIACKCRLQVVEFFTSLPRPHIVAIEAFGFYRWLWNLLEPLVDKLVLADATQSRALAGRRLKTDREDAQNIAELLALGRLPLGYAPPLEVQILKDQTRHRNQLSRLHAQVLNQVKSLMNTNNRPGPARLESDGLIRYLKAFASKLPERHVAVLWKYVDQLTLIERQIEQAEIELQRLLDQERFRGTAAILQSFPGVGLIVSATVLAEIGDFHRFTYRKAIAGYAGLHPKVFASGGKQREGHITKAGPPDLRWVLQQAAWTAIRTQPALKKMWLKISRSAGKKAAALAIARKILGWMWVAVLKGQNYQPRVPAARVT